MKAQAAKAKSSPAKPSPAKPSPAKSAALSKARPTPARPSKPVAKPALKNTGTKPSKTQPKAPAKPAPKAASKPLVQAIKKPMAKPLAKPAAKVVAKPVAKPVAKAVTKPVAKPVPKAVKNLAVSAKAKAKSKVPARPAAAVPVKQTPAKPDLSDKKSKASPAKPAVTTHVKESVKKKAVEMSAAKPASPLKTSVAPATVAVAPVPVAGLAVPLRAGRPSSRLAQLTVPSMAQSVASTAAKSSYSQSVPAPLIVPPLASAVKKDPKLANNWKTKALAELTPAELLAMPDSEYMNEVQLAYFRHKLVLLKQNIFSNAVDTTEHLREDTLVVPDPADRATIEEEHALELRTRDRERKLLKKIEQSIMRIESGDYGFCDETGESIGVGRLLARPTATLSLEAQQRRELKQKMFGD